MSEQCYEHEPDHDGDLTRCGMPAEVQCSFCFLPICRNHAHVCNKDQVACNICLAGLGGVE